MQVALRRISVGGTPLQFFDLTHSFASHYIRRELERDSYGIRALDFRVGDVVIDIGAHVGMFSIYLATRYPGVQVFAFEPVRENYQNLIKNIKINGVENVTPCNKAITQDGRNIEMVVHQTNTGGATANLRKRERPEHFHREIESITLSEIFSAHKIDRCKLLKIDCEGSEHEILRSTPRLGQVENLCGELHINSHLAQRGHSIRSLREYCLDFVPREKTRLAECRMAGG